MANRPYILVYKDPLLTYLLVSVKSILTLRYMNPMGARYYTSPPDQLCIFSPAAVDSFLVGDANAEGRYGQGYKLTSFFWAACYGYGSLHIRLRA